MALELTVEYKFAVTAGGEEVTMKHPVTVPAVSLAGEEVYSRSFAIAAATTAVLWDPTNDAGVPASFAWLAIVSDLALDLELTVDVGGEVATRAFTLRVAPNIPFLLGADDGSTTGEIGGAMDVVDKIRAKNIDETEAATVRLVLGR